MSYPKIPIQSKGESQDVVSMQCSNLQENAKVNFDKLLFRLKSVNKWHTYSDDVKGEFALIDTKTNRPTIKFKKENYIRIDAPGPGSPSGKGYDWVKIIDIQK